MERCVLRLVFPYLGYRDLMAAAKASSDWSIGIHLHFQKRAEQLRGLEPGLLEILEPIGKLEGDENSYRWDDLTELLDKAYQGLDVWDEHKQRKVRIQTRALLEARLLEGVEEGLKEVRSYVLGYSRRSGDAEAVAAEHQYLTFLISHLDRLYGEVHVLFLKAYLAHPKNLTLTN